MAAETLNTIFSNALLLLAVYFWYDTLKLLVAQNFDSENVMVLIVISVVITLIVYFWVKYLTRAGTNNQNDPHNLIDGVLNGPPPIAFEGRSMTNPVGPSAEQK